MIQLIVLTKTMQIKITSCLIGIIACSLAQARPQGNFNNYPYRPTFSDLDPYNNYYTTAAPYQQNIMRIWPYIIDQEVSPLYNWNWNGNGYNTGSSGYNTNGYGGYNTNSNGYNNPFSFGYTTANPYWSIYNPYGTNTGKK